MISIQTNVDSLIAQRNLSVDNQFQSNTIQQLTSGSRINKSGDDAAGLAIANAYQSQIGELTQGVNNANNGVSQLQIVDGGLSNISTILNRLKTLATESASSTFTGDRSTLNNEYSGLLSEVTRQATNINLNAAGSFNTNLNVFIGGGSDSGTSNSISIDLSGSANAVDATSLGLNNTNVLGGGVTFNGNKARLDAPGGAYLTGTSSTTAKETFAFNIYANGQATTLTTTIVGGHGAGISASDILNQFNSKLSSYGITASLDGNGTLQFSGATAFNVQDEASTKTLISASGQATASNSSNYLLDGLSAASAASLLPATGGSEELQFQIGNATATVTLTTANAASIPQALQTINAATSKYGLYAIAQSNSSGNLGIEFQSSSTFSVNSTLSSGSAGGIFGASSSYQVSAGPSEGTTNNATAAISAIDNAIGNLGLVQGVVGAGENKLQYAISLAQSQITNFSAAQSQLKDADVAAEAANLSKSQVLTQTAIAALAQANSEPQSVLKLLQ